MTSATGRALQRYRPAADSVKPERWWGDVGKLTRSLLSGLPPSPEATLGPMSFDAEALRGLLRSGPARVCVALPSGDCWGVLVEVRGTKVAVVVTGITLRLPLTSVRDALPAR